MTPTSFLNMMQIQGSSSKWLDWTQGLALALEPWVFKTAQVTAEEVFPEFQCALQFLTSFQYALPIQGVFRNFKE